MAGTLSLNTKLYMGDVVSSGTPTFSEIPNVQSVPQIFGTPESVEVTVLTDDTHKYIAGLKNLGDGMAFGLLYDNSAATSNFRVLKAAEGVNKEWKIELPDGTTVTFQGKCYVSIDAIEVNAALTFTCTIFPESALTVTNPAA